MAFTIGKIKSLNKLQDMTITGRNSWNIQLKNVEAQQKWIKLIKKVTKLSEIFAKLNIRML